MAGYPPTFGVPGVFTPPPPPQQIAAVPAAVNVGSPAPGATTQVPVPPAVAARDRKNDKIDQKRRQGTQARNILAQAPLGQWKPPPAPSGQPVNSTSDAPPVVPTPPNAVAEQTPTYEQPEYKKPKAGLEYLALGLSLLFPGSGISRVAAGFAQGMNQGTKEGYERNVEQAKDKYAAAEEKAKVDYANAEAQRQATMDKQAADFQNQQIAYQQKQQLRANGIDPVTGRAFVLPPNLAAPPPPHAGYGYLIAHARATEQWYLQHGAIKPAADLADQITSWAADLRQQQELAGKLYLQTKQIEAENKRTEFVQSQENARTGAHIAAEWGIHDDTERNANLRFEIEQATKGEVSQGKLVEQYTGATMRLANTMRELTSQPTYKLGKDGKPLPLKDSSGNPVPQLGPNGQPMKDAQGNPVYQLAPPIKAPPLSDPNVQKSLQAAFKTIQQSDDPIGLATHFAQRQGTDPTSSAVADVLMQQGNVAYLNMMRTGKVPNPRPESYYDHLDQLQDQAEAKRNQALLVRAGLNPRDPLVKEGVEKAQSLGLSLSDPQVMQQIKLGMHAEAAPAGETFHNRWGRVQQPTYVPPPQPQPIAGKHPFVQQPPMNPL